MKSTAIPATLSVGALAALSMMVAGSEPSISHPASSNAQSIAAFGVMADVVTSPRCQNCHTLTEYPRQGDDRHPHMFNVMRGPGDRGAAGLHCSTCHGRANNSASGVPGAAEVWRLAPVKMGWETLSRAELCRHLKDRASNGNRSGAQVIDHLSTHLVMWAWTPGTDAHGHARTTPPISHADFVKAAEAWVRTGQACP